MRLAYIVAIRFGQPLLTNCSQIPGDGQGQAGIIGDRMHVASVQEGTARDREGRKGTQPVRLLTARLWVRVPPPEPFLMS
jgi:hypothetical protein